jgi:hypothetical protein
MIVTVDGPNLTLTEGDKELQLFVSPERTTIIIENKNKPGLETISFDTTMALAIADFIKEMANG